MKKNEKSFKNKEDILDYRRKNNQKYFNRNLDNNYSSYKKFKPEEVEEILKGEKTYYQLAQEMGRTVHSIVNKVYKLKQKEINMPKCSKNYKNLDKRDEYIKRNKDNYYERYNSTFATNNKKLWTKEEDNLILNSELLDIDIARQIGRSLKAIHTRRSKLKKEINKMSELELGNLMFNPNKNQQYECPKFIIALLKDIERKLNVVMYNKNHTQYESPFDNTGNSFTDLASVFEVHAYNWNDDISQDYNFVFKTDSILGDIKISWYKYLGRDTTINYDCRGSEKIILDLYNNCLEAMDKYAEINKNFHNTTYTTTRATDKSEWEIGNCNDKDVLFLNLKGNNDLRFSRFHINIKDAELLTEDLSNVIMKSYFEDESKIRLTRKKKETK